MHSERIMITVRTYPTLSKNYEETVCTGGINDQGEWRRLFPVSLRMLDPSKQFKTYDIVEVRVGDSSADGRPESRRPDTASLKVVGHLSNWADRSEWVRPTVFESLAVMRSAGRTLAPVRVARVLELAADEVSEEWTARQVEILKQSLLFDDRPPLEKIPFDFRLRWVDGGGQEHDSKFIAWEVCETWRQFKRRYGSEAVPRLRETWLRDRLDTKFALYFFMGNFAQHPQHFGVTGVFHPPRKDFDEPSLNFSPRA